MGGFEDRQHAGALVALRQSTRAAPAAAGVPEPETLAEANLYAVCELIAARAARPSTRRQYAGIFGRFCDVLRAELGRPPTVADLTSTRSRGTRGCSSAKGAVTPTRVPGLHVVRLGQRAVDQVRRDE